MIEIRFLCGHSLKSKNTVSSAQCYCQQPGSNVVTSVKAPAPAFTGTVLGPNSQFKNLGPKDVSQHMKPKDQNNG